MPGTDVKNSGMSEARICPECGTRNSGLSLFCAECGAALFHDPSGSGEETSTGTTSTFAPAQDPNATAEFIPVNASAQDTMASSGRWTPSVPQDTWSSPAAPPAEATFVRPESRRGLVLGWIASVLIALVIGFVIWSSLLSPGVRDTISGWFG
jgi:hypothetical protein